MVQKKLTTYFSILIICFLSFSCTRKETLEKGEYWLQSQSFKGNKEFSTDELEVLIPANQKPNRKLFSLPITPAVWWYEFGRSVFDSAQKSKRYAKISAKLAKLPSDSVFYDAQTARRKIRLREKLSKLKETREAKIAWFWRNIGEPPTKITEDEFQKTAKNINAFLKRKGYIESTVEPIVSPFPNGKIHLIYTITEGIPYKLDSIFYDFHTEKIDSLVQHSLKNSFLKPHQNYDQNEILSERTRIESLLKNNGFYLFDKQLIGITILKTEEEFKKSRSASIRFSLKDTTSFKPQLQPFTIESLVFTALDANTPMKMSAIDTVTKIFNGTKYIFIDKKFPVRLLDSKIAIRSGNLYRQSQVLETQRQLSLLDQFTFANVRFADMGDSKLRATITAPTLERYFVTGDISGNTVQDILGGGISGTLRIRNMLHSLENVEIGLKFALEGQPAALNLSNQLSRELGANVALNFPQLILPNKIAQKFALKRPRTQLNLGVNYSSQIYRETMNFRFSGNYSWRKSAYETFQIAPIDMSLINTTNQSEAFIEALREEPTLQVLYAPQFLSSINGFYVYNNQILGQNSTAKYLRIFAEAGGTLMNFLKNKDELVFLDKLIPSGTDSSDIRKYYRFWKLNLDYRKYIKLSKTNSFNYRVNIGFGQSYGKNNTLPFQKSFFAGGSNSVRAWSPRSLGPGSSKPSYFVSDSINKVGQYLPQPGDIIMEGSVEYRGRLGRFLVGDMNYGVFIDVGNVWNWYQYPEEINKANFDFKRFYKEFAVGTGFGFRWDLSFFVFRYDLGIKVYDPSQPQGSRFVLNRFNFSDPNNAYYRLQSNFAIGYPF